MSENLNKLFSPILVVESITASKTLDQYDSGKIFTLDLAAGLTVTLPLHSTAGAGWVCKIIVGTNCTSNSYIISESVADANTLVVQVAELNELTDTVGPSSTGHTTITLGNATDTVGDTFDIICDGSKFYIQGVTKLDGGAALAEG